MYEEEIQSIKERLVGKSPKDFTVDEFRLWARMDALETVNAFHQNVAAEQARREARKHGTQSNPPSNDITPSTVSSKD